MLLDSVGDLIDFFEFTYRVPEENIVFIKNPTLMEVGQAWNKLNERIEANKDKKYFVLNVYTGHGMNINEQGWIPLNEYNEHTHFYKMFPFESTIKSCAARNPNTFHVGLFILCRTEYTIQEYWHCFHPSDAEQKEKEAIEKGE